MGASGQVMLRHRMSTLFRVLSRPWFVKIMAAKVGPLAARSPYQPPNKSSTSIQARPQAKHPKPLLKRLRFVTKTLPPYVTNVSTGS